MEAYSIARLSPDDLDRLAELHNRLYREDPSTLLRSGDRLRARYQGALGRGEMAVWIAHSPADGKDGQEVGFAWFLVNRGEFSLKEIDYLPERRSVEAYAALIKAGLDWLKQKGGRGCRYTGAQGDPDLEQGLQRCGFQLEEEHIQMRARLDSGLLSDSGLKTRSFAEIGDASWLLSLVEECLDCRHPYDRQDLLDVIKRRNPLSFTAWEDEQPVGFLIGEALPRRGGREDERPVLYVEEIGVRPAYRRQGYATRLLAEAFARARGRGMQEANLHVVGDNQAGLGLYRKLGFVEIKRVAWWKLA